MITAISARSADGYRIDVYLSMIPGVSGGVPLGSNLCIYTYLQNLDNNSTALPSVLSLYVTNVNSSDTSVWSGVIFSRSECAVPASYSGSFGPNSTGWNCNVVWNTSQPYNGLLPNAARPDVWEANETIRLSNSSTFINAPYGLPASFKFTTASSPATTTTTTSTTAAYYCGGPIFERVTPMQNGPLYLKVVTNQGSIITNNGTVFVTHIVPAANGISGGTADYCLNLQGNATGYLELAANDSLLPTGSYNLTLFAGYNQGPGYQATIPPVTVQPNTTVYVTLSVPSGDVTMVTCTQGSSSCATTTTTATSIASGG
jgi:hypothetical protein